jgi:hypothetical protein
MISYEYLDILRRKSMEKLVAKEIKENKWKKGEKQAKWATKLGCVADWIVWKCAKKCAKAKFIAILTPIVVVEVGDYFHQKFKASLHVDP